MVDEAELQALSERAQKWAVSNEKWPSVGTLRNWSGYKLSRKQAQVLRDSWGDVAKESVPSKTSGPLAVGFPAARAPKLDEWPTIPAPALVFSDLHIPAQHEAWITTIVSEAVSRGIRRAVIAGDMFDFGHLSKFPQDKRWTTEEELQDGVVFMKWLLQHMDEVHFFPGNHDDRLAKKLDRQVTNDWFFNMLFAQIPGAKIKVYWHQHAFLGKKWLISHPGNYSRVVASIPRQLASKFHRHVAIGHTHAFGMGWDISGQYMAIEMGMTADAARLSYKQREMTTHPASSVGALLILPDELPILLHPGIGRG